MTDDMIYNQQEINQAEFDKMNEWLQSYSKSPFWTLITTAFKGDNPFKIIPNTMDAYQSVKRFLEKLLDIEQTVKDLRKSFEDTSMKLLEKSKQVVQLETMAKEFDAVMLEALRPLLTDLNGSSGALAYCRRPDDLVKDITLIIEEKDKAIETLEKSTSRIVALKEKAEDNHQRAHEANIGMQQQVEKMTTLVERANAEVRESDAKLIELQGKLSDVTVKFEEKDSENGDLLVRLADASSQLTEIIEIIGGLKQLPDRSEPETICASVASFVNGLKTEIKTKDELIELSKKEAKGREKRIKVLEAGILELKKLSETPPLNETEEFRKDGQEETDMGSIQSTGPTVIEDNGSEKEAEVDGPYGPDDLKVCSPYVASQTFSLVEKDDDGETPITDTEKTGNDGSNHDTQFRVIEEQEESKDPGSQESGDSDNN